MPDRPYAARAPVVKRATNVYAAQVAFMELLMEWCPVERGTTDHPVELRHYTPAEVAEVSALFAERCELPFEVTLGDGPGCLNLEVGHHPGP